MKQKHMKPYESPAVLKACPVELQAQLLAGSVVTPNTKIETAGQDVDNHSFGDSSFDNKWE